MLQVKREIQNTKRQLCSKKGASLAETLVTVLIMSIVMMAVAGGAVVVQRVYHDVRLRADAQTLLSTTVMAVSEDLYYCDDIELGDGGIVAGLYPENRKYRVQFRNHDGNIERRSLETEGQTKDEDIKVITNRTRTLGLSVELANDVITYSTETNCFTFAVNVYREEDIAPFAQQQAIVHAVTCPTIMQ